MSVWERMQSLLLASSGRRVILVLAFAVAAPLSQLAYGADYHPAPSQNTSSRDAQSYADAYGVSLKEATLRLSLQGLIGEISASMEQSETDIYGGLWIEHAPAFRVVLALTSDDSTVVSRYFEQAGLGDLVQTRIVDHSMHELEAELVRLANSRDQEWQFDADVSVFDNRIEVRVLNEPSFLDGAHQRGVELSSNVMVLVVDALAQPATSVLQGGRPLSDCTSGFTVHSTSLGVDGLTTAGHCMNAQTYIPTGEALTYVTQNLTMGHDEQWHRLPGALAPNVIWDGLSGRFITDKRDRAFQNVGDWVCHYGKVTGFDCGTIVSRNEVVCNNGPGGVTGIKVHKNNTTFLAKGGDSGGPWFTNGVALGTMSCRIPYSLYSDAIYVAENYVESGLGVTIKTRD
jgi:hypothetical protein